MAATATDTPDAAERGLSSAEAAKRLRKVGRAPDTSSRSVWRIIAGNVFPLFNAIIGVFFMLILSLGLIADAIFGVIAIVNSYIGIRQELKAKRTLDELAVLVAPHAKVIRGGAVVNLLAEEIVPGDVIVVEPGDQLVADGETIASRGMTLDESMLTGEADGGRKEAGERVLSGSFCIAGPGRYRVDAVRGGRHAGRLAASAGDRNRTLETVAEAFPAQPGRVGGEVPFSSKWKWSGLRLGGVSYVLGAPDILAASGALALPPGLARKLEEETAAGRRVVAFGQSAEALPDDPAHAPAPRLAPVALVVLEETLRADAAATIATMPEAA